MEMILDKYEKKKKAALYEGDYWITSKGKVWSSKRNKWLKIYTSVTGYKYVVLSRYGKTKNMKIHRLVAEAFIKNPHNKPCINHRNGKKDDNRACNLEWCTARENMQHATDMGLNKIFKLSYDDKIIATQLHHLKDFGQSELARSFGVTPAAIHYIVNEYWPLSIDA
jgi:hypothetical protein